MSIDLFFVAAPFVCRDDGERGLLAKRITLAILVAGAFFLTMPLHMTFPRPHVGGFLGSIFDRFREMDQPYNLFPSLHITLRSLLVATYVRRTRGLLRLGVQIWFSLIGFSTLLVYQHHVVDVLGGFALGAACLYVVRETPWRLPVSRNLRVGVYYGVGAALLLITAALLRPLGLLLLWPVASLALVCAGYYGLGPGVFAKCRGRIPFSARLAMLPVLAGQYLSLRYYARQCRPWDKLTENVWIGRRLSEQEACLAIDQGVSAVLDLTGEFSEAAAFLALPYLNLPVMDLTAPTQSQTRQGVDFIRRHAADGIVYIHCKIGYSRTAAIAAAWLLENGLADNPQQAMQRLREARPSIVIRPEVRRLIESIEGSPARVS